MGEHVEILLRGVDHAQRFGCEQPVERRDVDRERIDQRHLLAVGGSPSDLHERELGVVRPFTVELGVECVAGLVEQGRRRRRRGRPVDRSSDTRAAGQSSAAPDAAPDTVSKPSSTQASIPPATLTTSTPCSARNSAGVGAARTRTAHHVGRRTVEGAEAFGHRAERYELGLGDVAALPLLRFTDVDDPSGWRRSPPGRGPKSPRWSRRQEYRSRSPGVLMLRSDAAGNDTSTVQRSPSTR